MLRALSILIVGAWAAASVQAQSMPILISGQPCLTIDSSDPAGPDPGDSVWCGTLSSSGSGYTATFTQTKDASPNPNYFDVQAISGDSFELDVTPNESDLIINVVGASGFSPPTNPSKFFAVVFNTLNGIVNVFYRNGTKGGGALCARSGMPAVAVAFTNVEPTFVFPLSMEWFPNQASATHLKIANPELPEFPFFAFDSPIPGPDMYIPAIANGGDPIISLSGGEMTLMTAFSSLGPCPNSIPIGEAPDGLGGVGGVMAPLLSTRLLATLVASLFAVGLWVLRRSEGFRRGLPPA